jgi:formate C-acetyltransferase
MYKLAPITDRVKRIREKYRTTKPQICIERYRLITKFYKEHPELGGILRRAKNFHNICERIPVRIFEDEVIVGTQASVYRGAALYPENSVDWLKSELESGRLMTRDIDPYIISDEDREYVLSTVDYWMTECMSAKTDAQIVDEYVPHSGNGVTMFTRSQQTPAPVGHFCVGYDTAVRKGFAAIKEEAEQKRAELIEQGVPYSTIEQYNFYRAISLVCDGVILLTKRYARLAWEMYEAEIDPVRKEELGRMAEVLDWTVEKPARNFHEAIQCLFLYQTALCLDANLHGISWGRVDQYLGDFYDADIKNGTLTPEYGQELLDLFYLKIAAMNKPWSYEATSSNPGYTTGQLMTLGGVKRGGEDATNAVTYMMLQTSGRLVLHSPPQALRIHQGTPTSLWEAAVETTKIAGGVPSYENDDVIIPSLMERGLSLEDARDYCLIGCVEPAGCGTEWPACGGTGSESYMNLANALLLSINDGYTFTPLIGPFQPAPEGTENIRVGPSVGYLYDMKSIDEVKEAFKRQIEYFVKWHFININSFEYIARDILPLPIVSATMAGCMKSGKDVMYGGAKYNSTGNSGVGLGNVADSLNIINHCVFEKKICTGRELYDALFANWKGYEDLHNYILNEAPHYGNGIPGSDEFAGWAAKVFADACVSHSGPRGNKCSAGMYPVTLNVVFGYGTKATPDGRFAGQALADGIGPVQEMDKNGPTAVILSLATIDQKAFSNGTLQNMKFHPSALKKADGIEKLTNLMQTYFQLGGMELQINVVGVDTLKKAQEVPEDYQDLVVRVAGFSAYFVELHKDGQSDLIRRTELELA